MKIRDIPPQLSGVAAEPSATTAQREPLARYVTLSAVVHGVVVLGLLGSVWLWGTPTYFKPSLYTVSLVDAPLTLRQATQAGGGEKPATQPTPIGDQQPVAPAESAAKPASVEQPPAPMKVIPAEPVKVIPAEPVKVIPAEPAPKATPPTPKAVAEPQEKKPEPKELKKPEPAEPKKPALEEPKKPVTSPPPPAATTATEARQVIDKLRERQAQVKPAPPSSATATEARQSVDKLRARQAQEAKAQADAAQAQQRTAEEKLAALRARYGTSGTGGSGPGGGATGSGSGGPLGDLQHIRLQAYQERVYELIRAAWLLPMPQEEARKLQATALLIVSRDGQVARFQLLKTSGNPMFDESLLRAIKQVDPLPPLPEDYQGGTLEVELRFRTRES
jgi:TonB family protein